MLCNDGVLTSPVELMATLEAFCPICRRTVHFGADDPDVCPVCSSRLMGPGLDEARARRIADNESVVRAVNERIERIAAASPAYPPDEKIAFVCECGDSECSTAVHLTVDEYESVRADPARFVTIPGHEVVSAERIVRRVGDSHVVEKVGVARNQAREEDPRS